MNRFILGDLDTKFKVGGDDCSIYLGTEKLYPAIPQKYKLTLSDTSVVTAACDSTNAVTQAEISAYTSTLVSAELGDCVTEIGNRAFISCSGLTYVNIPSGVTSISDAVFAGCRSLPSVDIPSGVTSIGNYAFQHCGNLTSIDIPTGVTFIGNSAFQNCSGLTSIDIPTGVTSISNSAFYYCSSLTSIDIPSGVTTIGTYAFYTCTGLTSIAIPSGVTSIDSSAFYGCSSLTSIYCYATTPPTLGSNAFNSTNNCPIYVPSGSVNAYKSASGWSRYESRIQAIP